MCGGTHLDNTRDVEEVLVTNFEKKGSGAWSFDLVAGKDNVREEVIKINEHVKAEMLSPLRNRIATFFEKAKESGLEVEIDFESRINALDDSAASFKKDVFNLSNEIGKEIASFTPKIMSAIEQEVSSYSEKVMIKESNLLNVQEVTRPMLNVIDNTGVELGMAIINNDGKVTFGFVLAQKNVNDANVDRIKAIAEKFGLRGNGKKQQYIFGGKTFDTAKMIEEIKGWEF